MSAYRYLVLVCLSLAPLLVTAEESANELWPLAVYDLDALILQNGDPKVGTIEEVRADGTVVFIEAGASGAIGYRPSQYRNYRYRRTAQEVLDQRMELLLAQEEEQHDPFAVMETLRWALNQDEETLLDPVKEWSTRAAVTMAKHQPMLEYTLDLLEPNSDDAAIEQVARAGIEHNPNWETGYNVLMQVLHRQNRVAELREAIALTLAERRNNHLANRYYADLAMAEGDLEAAREAYRKASASNDTEALLGFATASLMLRQWSGAERGAQQLITAGEELGPAAAILASVHLHAGELEEAEQLFATAMENGSLSGELQRISQHNLGLLYYQRGEVEPALEMWSVNDHPASKLAVAVATNQAVNEQQFADYPSLKQTAEVHHVQLSLLNQENAEEVTSALNPEGDLRHRFFEQIRLLLASQGEAGRVGALRLTDSDESRRWQIYGHLLAASRLQGAQRDKRLEQAWEVANQLSESDGYAAVCKSYIRFSQGEQEGAATIYRNLVEPLFASRQGAPPPPSGYVAVLAAEFEVAAGQYRRHEFDWPDGERLGAGWDRWLSPGSNMQVRVEGQQLIIDNGAEEGFARAWCRVREATFERVVLEAAYPEADQLRGGIEVLDGAQQQGVAVAVGEQRRLQWRQLRGGKWGQWQDFTPSITLASQQDLTLNYRSPGRVQIRDRDNQPTMVGEPFSAGSHVAVALFLQADAEQSGRLQAQHLDIGQRQP